MQSNQKATIGATYKPANVGAWRDSAEHYKSVVALVDGELKHVIKSLIKRPRDGAGRLRVVVWLINGNAQSMHGETYRHGCGIANGYGYHKASAAIGGALRAAGVTLDNDIDGRGDGAVDDALIATASAMLGKPLTRDVDALIVE